MRTFGAGSLAGATANRHERTLRKSESNAQHHQQNNYCANTNPLQKTTEKFSQPHSSIVQLLSTASDVTIRLILLVVEARSLFLSINPPRLFAAQCLTESSPGGSGRLLENHGSIRSMVDSRRFYFWPAFFACAFCCAVSVQGGTTPFTRA
jgi:hypothetical protein